MSTVASPSFRHVVDADRAVLIRRARRTWRRAGVRRPDRDALAAELNAELEAAQHDQRDLAEVTGETPTSTLQEWAVERGLAGRSLRLGLLAGVTLACIALGAAVLITTAVVTVAVPGAPFISHGAIWLAALINGAITSWILAPLACWAVLHHGRDPQAGPTARWLFVLLPVAALVGFAISTIAAIASGYEAWISIVIAALFAMAFTAAAATARTLAIRYSRAALPWRS